MNKTKEVDFQNRREVLVQTAQATFHMVMSILILCASPTEYIQSPVFATKDLLYGVEKPLSSLGVNIIYGVAAAYNTVLYFWDPLSNRPIRFYHIIAVLVAPLLLVYDHLSQLSMFMLSIYFVDLTETLLQYKYAPNHFDKRRLLLGLIKFHHMITLLLIGFSWVHNYTPLGIFILFIHDVTDVPMFVIRILRRKNASAAKNNGVAVIVIGSWLYYRVFSMFWILSDIYIVGTTHIVPDVLSGCACFLGLCALWTLNVYWTGLVVFKAFQEVSGITTQKDDE